MASAGRSSTDNVIPANRIDPIALKVLALFPLPNTGGIGAGGLTNNYKRQEDRTFNRDNVTARSTGTAPRRTRSGASSAT